MKKVVSLAAILRERYRGLCGYQFKFGVSENSIRSTQSTCASRFPQVSGERI